MITSIKHKGLKELHYDGRARYVSPNHAAKLKRILTALDNSDSLQGMNLPGFGLHGLKGDRSGHHAVRVSENWRVTFRFTGDGFVDVDYDDYH